METASGRERELAQSFKAMLDRCVPIHWNTEGESMVSQARSMMEQAKVKPDMAEYRSARQNGDDPVKAMRAAIGKAEDMAYAKRQQKKAQEKFSLQLDILANAVADLTSDDPKVAAEARKTLKDHTDGYWRTLVILDSSDMADLMGYGD